MIFAILSLIGYGFCTLVLNWVCCVKKKLCYRCLFSLSPEIEMAEKQEFFDKSSFSSLSRRLLTTKVLRCHCLTSV